MTLELAADSPILEMPWIITFGPLSDEEDWEPVVCGPYERPHAIALAEEVVADEELMAVVEPVHGRSRRSTRSGPRSPRLRRWPRRRQHDLTTRSSEDDDDLDFDDT